MDSARLSYGMYLDLLQNTNNDIMQGPGDETTNPQNFYRLLKVDITQPVVCPQSEQLFAGTFST